MKTMARQTVDRLGSDSDPVGPGYRYLTRTLGYDRLKVSMMASEGQ
jgi:hypothetical protein